VCILDGESSGQAAPTLRGLPGEGVGELGWLERSRIGHRAGDRQPGALVEEPPSDRDAIRGDEAADRHLDLPVFAGTEGDVTGAGLAAVREHAKPQDARIVRGVERKIDGQVPGLLDEDLALGPLAVEPGLEGMPTGVHAAKPVSALSVRGGDGPSAVAGAAGV